MSHLENQDKLKVFLGKRQMVLIGDLDGRRQEELCGQILYLNAVSDEKITLFIDSFGGGVRAALHLFDTIILSKAPVEGIVIGTARSAVFVVLQACNDRIAYPHATFMYHAPGLVEQRVDQVDLEEQIEKYKAFHEELLQILVKHGKGSLEQFRQWAREEKILDAQEALRVGIIDEILYSH